jgi:cyclic pyranopterin monophosphate synthase
MPEQFSHLDEKNRVSMVNVAPKIATSRSATARSIIEIPPEIVAELTEKSADLPSKKGPVFQTAVLAGIMAAKKTGDLIPLCHPIGLENCEILIHFDEKMRVVIDCTASVHAKTGVEMEALVGASIAALTIYDMCKAMSHDIRIVETQLIAKTGGKNDFQR